MQKNITTNPGIYLHIPFCERKCVYCDFYSVTDRSFQRSFVQSLLRELRRKAELARKERFDTIYFGGGTPSLLTLDELSEILKSINSIFNISPNAEITIEVNPGTVDHAKLAAYKNMGINRLSIGIQSFNDDELRFLGRIHNARQAREIVKAARHAGFDNISLDLISSLPGQTLKSWRANLSEAVEYRPEHISAYTLIIEEGTPLYKRVLKEIVKPKAADEEALFYETTVNILERNGYLHYEVSSFAQNKKYISRHNFKYWNHSPYFGFGPSAHSFWNKRRFKNVASVADYIKKIESGETIEVFSENPDAKTLEFEYIFLRLRTFLGVDLREFKTRFAHDFSNDYSDTIKKLTDNGFAEIDGNSLRLTKAGLMLSDEILPDFAK